MRAIFLCFHDPASGKRYVELCDGDSAVDGQGPAYLPRSVEDEIHLTKLPTASSYIELEVASTFVSLTVFGEEHCVLLCDNIEYTVPQSNAANHKSILLRDQDHFTSCAGRWSIEWDDEAGSISCSMRPPAPPQVMAQIESDEIAAPERTGDGADGTISPNPQHEPPTTHTAITPVEETPGIQGSEDDDRLQSILKNSVRAVKQKDRGSSSASIDFEATEVPLSQEVKDAEDAVAIDSETESEHESAESLPVPQHTPAELANLSDNGVIGEKSTDALSPARSPVDNQHSIISFNSPGSKHPGETDDNVSLRQTHKRKIDAENDHETDRRSKRGKETAYPIPTSLADAVDSEDASDIGDTIEVAPGPGKRHGRHRPRRSTPVDSPARSTRSHDTPKSSQHSSSCGSVAGYEGASPTVYFASTTKITGKKKTMDTFRRLGGTKVEMIPEANMLLIGDGPLKKSVNFLLALAQGCDIVTEEWIVEAHRKNQLPDPSRYLPRDPEREKEWKFCLKDAVDRGKRGLGQMLHGFAVSFTNALVADLQASRTRELATIATKLGADPVKCSRNSLPKKKMAGKILILGIAGDPEGGRVSRLGEKLYHRDILSMAVLRGKLEFDSEEFLLEAPIKDEELSE